MSSPKHQHFIPKSYLKNFSIKQDEKFFIEGKLKSEDLPKPKLLSIKDICVDRNLYTIPDIEGDDKYMLERYYAKEVDSVYPSVYELMTNPYQTTLNKIQKREIILTTMSLFFRTPKFLNLNQRRTDIIIDYAIKNHADQKGNVKFKHNDLQLDFNVIDSDKVRVDCKIKNKLQFLKNHLKDWHTFIELKMDCGLQIIKIDDEIDLITSDNPVDMHSIHGNAFNIFDPTNMISVPLDNKHYLIIYPNTESNIENLILRGVRDKRFALTRNYCTEQNAEEWILGKPTSIIYHMKDQEKYGAQTEENDKMVDQMREQAYDAKRLQDIIDEKGLYHMDAVEKLRELLKKPMHQHNNIYREMEKRLKENGLGDVFES